MEIALPIIFVGLLVFLAHFFAWLFSFVRIPDVLLLMCIGILIGPLLGIVSPDFLGEAGNVLVMLILVLILFEGAIKLKFVTLKKAMLGTFSLAFVSFFLTMFGIGYLLYHFAGFPLIPSFLIGAIVGSNSTAIVIPIVQKLKIRDESRTTLFLESGVSDVLSIVFTLAFIASLEVGIFHIDAVISDVLITLFAATVIGGFFAFLWSLLLNKVHNIQNSVFATPAFVFIIYGITELFGYSGLISVIVFGIVLGNIPFLATSLRERNYFIYKILHPQPLSSRELSFFSETVFLVKIFFFIFIGVSLNFTNIPFLLLGFLLAIFIFAARIPAILFSIPKSTPRFDTAVMAVTAPRGLAPAILALIPLQKGLVGGEVIQEITYTVIFFSILLASILLFLIYNTKIRKIYEYLLPGFAPNPVNGTQEYPSKEKESAL